MNADDLDIGGEPIPLGFAFAAPVAPAVRREARMHMRELIAAGADPETACSLACHTAALLDPEDSRVLDAVEQWDDLALARVVNGDRSVKLLAIADWLGTDRIEALGRVIDKHFAMRQSGKPSASAPSTNNIFPEHKQ